MFWNREELPPELRDKKPAEIADRLKKLEELETKSKEYETTRAELETKLTAQTSEFDQVKARLQEIEQNAAQQQAQPYMQPPPQPPQEPTSIWNDPDKYIAEKLASTQAATLFSLRNSARINFENNLSPRDRKIFKKYEGEVDRAMASYPLQYQADPQYWNVALKYIKGDHEQDLSKADSADSPFFSEPASRGAAPEPPPEEKLTAEEEEVCRRFHFDPKGYLQRKKERIILQGEKGAYARYPVPPRTPRT